MSISAETLISCVLTEFGAKRVNEFLESAKLNKRCRADEAFEVEFWVLNYLFNEYFFNNKAELPIKDNLITSLIDNQSMAIASLIEDGVIRNMRMF